MCFSASASFISATCIASLGLLTHKRVQHRRERPLAWIPILFAVQQLIEGFIWLSLTHQWHLAPQTKLAGAFLFFAWVVWPVLVPWASLSLEKNQYKRFICKGLLVLGVLVAIVSLLQLFFAHPEVIRVHKHLVYQLSKMPTWPMAQLSLQILYVAVTLLPLLLSSNRGLKGLGITNTVALFVSFIIFRDALPSVWCFFAAILSIQIVFILPIPEKHISP